MAIVVTGMGVVGPGFHNISQYENVLKSGICQLKEEKFDDTYLYLGRVIQDNLVLSHHRTKKLPMSVKMALHACEEAVESAAISLRDYRVAVIIGSSGGVIKEVITNTKRIEEGKISPFTIGNINANSLSTSISSLYGLTGMSVTLANSCTSSMDALHLANIILKSNQADVCIVGGSDATICETVLKGFLPLKVMQTGEKGQGVFGPFSGGRGFCMSEGAGVLIVEREDIAKKREATVLGIIEETSLTQDAVSSYQSDPMGRAMMEAVSSCLEKGMPTYINSQALGIEENDKIEEKIYETFFDSSRIPITSIKGIVGHSMGASAMWQIIASLISIKENFIPGTFRKKYTYEPNIFINHNIIEQGIENVLITSHGYGGNNACALISKGGA